MIRFRRRTTPMSMFRWIEPAIHVRRMRYKPEQLLATDSSAWFSTAEKCRNAGNLKEAVTWYEKAVAFDSDLFEAWIGLVDSLVRLGDIEKAASVTEEALRLYRLARPFYALKALVLLHDNQEAESLRYSDISVEQDEAGWYPWLVRGEILLREHLCSRVIENARYCFERSVSLADNQWVASLWVGVLYLVHRHPAFAAAYLAESAHLNPLNAFTYVKMGDAFRAMQLFDQARFYYEQAIDIDPTSDPARRGLADALAARSRISYLIDVDSAQTRWKGRFGLDRIRHPRTG